MAQYSNFIRTDLENGYVICDDVHLCDGTVCRIFLSSSNAYVLSCDCSDPKKHFALLQDVLGISKIRLYLLGDEDDLTGLYDPAQDAFVRLMDEDALTEDVNAWLDSGRSILNEPDPERVIARIRSADIKARGYWVNDEGEVLILRRGELRKASPKSSEVQYFLTLFAGTLGFHRFALGKIFSGLIYLFTGGFFLAGWLSDLLQLFLGVQKDSKKRYLFPLSNLKTKFLLLPLGLVVGLIFFFLNRMLSELFFSGIGDIISSEIKNADPNSVRTFVNFMNGFFTQ